MDSTEIVPGSAEDRDITRFEDKPFPSLTDAFSAVLGDAEVGEFTPYAAEVGLLASGEVTYKIRVKELEDTVSGVVALR